ncbi:MAG: SDR family oxidoreductase [Chloroflexaceae bacterium]|nr:SDR family oxidoreductase [Chloroflexaceae bacterium]
MTGASVLITGASSGIGKASVLHMAGMGWQVFAGVRRSEDGAALQREATNGASTRIVPLLLDITDGAAIADAAETIEQQVGAAGLTGLVNNAGIAIAGPLEGLPLTELRRQFEVNLFGHVAVSQAMLPLLRRARQQQGRATLINVGSIGGRLATPFNGPYHSTKFAMEGLTDSLRQELRGQGVAVVLVAPGSIQTPIWDKGISRAIEQLGHMSPQMRELYTSRMLVVMRLARQVGVNAITADVVARVIAKALVAPRPNTRYFVGVDTYVGRVLARLPDQWRDWMLAQGIDKESERAANETA